jgi:hypothetical protein
VFAATPQSRKVIEQVLPDVSTRVIGLSAFPQTSGAAPAVRNRPKRLGVYQAWVPSMDEGWTRLVLEKFRFRYLTIHNAEIRAGDLLDRVDTILIPSISARTLRSGYEHDHTEPTYTGGLGREGIEALRAFVDGGGTLVCLEDSCALAIAELSLPVKNVLAGLSNKTFFGPGSVLAIKVKPTELTAGMPAEASAYFDRSLAFDVEETSSVSVPVRYAAANVLESGWLVGAEKIEGKAAVVQLTRGKGRVILFAFPPQHRGQTHGTFRLLFNALR